MQTSIIGKRIFFWVLVALFFATAPLIIFYSMGYRFNSQRGIFMYTGSISIKSNPQNLDVYIDGELMTKKLNRINNSYHIGGIKPGEHLIEAKYPGYGSWTKKITVNSGTSTEFWNVLLTKDNYEWTELSTEGIVRPFFDPVKKLIAYTKNQDNEFQVNILDVESEEAPQTVFRSSEYSFISDDERENIEWAPKSQKIIVPAIKDGHKNYFVVDVKTKGTIDLMDLTNAKSIQKVRWDQNNKNFIYYLADNNLHYLNTEEPFEDKVIAKDVVSYDLSSGYAYFFQTSGIVYRIDPESGSETPEQMTTSAPDMKDSNYQITVYDEKRIAFLNKNGELYIYNSGEKDTYFKRLSSNAKEIQFSNDGKKIIYWNDWEISVYFTRDWKVQPWRNENEQKEVIRFSEPISNIQWSKDYEHVIFAVGNRIKIAEIDPRSQNNIEDILVFDADKTKVVSDTFGNKLYFISQKDRQNYLYSIEFPEPEGLMIFGG
jgi:hypothetical protein